MKQVESMQHLESIFCRFSAALVVGAALSAGMAYAGDGAAPSAPPAPTRHQMMKDCMAKERAASSGRPGYELTADCRDITKTEKQNADAQKKAQDELDRAADTPSGS
jgi:hypothetical protein